MKEVHYQDTDAFVKLSKALYDKLKPVQDREIAYLCIGTDRSTGDSLGPLIGTLLKNKGVKNVYGTFDDPAHMISYKAIYEIIKADLDNPYIVAIDAGLSTSDNVGLVMVKDEGVWPGSGVGKETKEIGDMSIVGIVNVGGFMEYYILQNTRLSLVMNMADLIASVIDVIGGCR